jgi:hypothetical protein
MRFARDIILASCVAVLSAALFAATSPSPNSIFDSPLYRRLVATELASLDEIGDDFDMERFSLLPLLPPDPDFPLEQSSAIRAFDPDGFPRSFLDGLIPEDGGDIPVYTVTVYEDPVSRDRILLNGNNREIGRIKAPADYDPYEYVRETFPQAVGSPAEYSRLKALYDPARIIVRYPLIAKKDIKKYALRAFLEKEQKDKSAGTGGGISPLMAVIATT